MFLATGEIAAQIKGKVLKFNGKPLAHTEIELVPVDSDKIVNSPNLIGISDGAGRFAFLKIPKGKYTLSINFDDKPTDLSPYITFFYPAAKKRADAQVFEIDEKTPLKTISFQLPPPLQQIKITGKVVNSDGQPMADVYVDLRDAMFDENYGFTFKTKTDKKGAFTLNGFENRLYQVGAILLAKPLSPLERPETLAMTATEIFLLTQKTPSFTLRLKESDADSLRNRNRQGNWFPFYRQEQPPSILKPGRAKKATA